jgi:hypothetical protein
MASEYVYQTEVEYVSNGHKMYQHLPLKDPPKFTQIGIFGLKLRCYVTVLNPNVPNANMPNVTVPNLNMLMCHSAECTTETNYNMPKCKGVDVKNCRTLRKVQNRKSTKPTNCQTYRTLFTTTTNPTLLDCPF